MIRGTEKSEVKFINQTSMYNLKAVAIAYIVNEKIVGSVNQ